MRPGKNWRIIIIQCGMNMKYACREIESRFFDEGILALYQLDPFRGGPTGNRCTDASERWSGILPESGRNCGKLYSGERTGVSFRDGST